MVSIVSYQYHIYLFLIYLFIFIHLSTVCKGIVEKHNGKISVFSLGEGYGCTFTVNIPITFRIELIGFSSLSNVSMNLHDVINNKVISDTSNTEDISLRYESLYANKEDENLTTNLQYNKNYHNFNEVNPIFNKEDKNITTSNSLSSEYIIPPSPIIHNNISNTDMLNTSNNTNPSHSILIVDDSSSTRKMMNRLLNNYNYNCIEAKDGSEAVDIVREKMKCDDIRKLFHVIVMDYQMPLMDGPTAIKLMRDEGYSGLIIGVTGNVLEVDKLTMINAGANHVMSKPFDIDVFESIMEGNLVQQQSSVFIK